jgi:hypothetical protein
MRSNTRSIGQAKNNMYSLQYAKFRINEAIIKTWPCDERDTSLWSISSSALVLKTSVLIEKQTRFHGASIVANLMRSRSHRLRSKSPENKDSARDQVNHAKRPRFMKS